MERNNLEDKMNSNTTGNKLSFGKRALIGLTALGLGFSGAAAAKNDTVGEWLANTYFNTKKAVIKKLIDWRKSDLDKQWAENPETFPNLIKEYVLEEDDFGKAFTPELETLFSKAQGFELRNGDLAIFPGSDIYQNIVDSYKNGRLDEITTEFSQENQSTKITVSYADGSKAQYVILDEDGNIEEKIQLAFAKASGDYEIIKNNDPKIKKWEEKIKELQDQKESLYDHNPHWNDELRSNPEYSVNLGDLDKLEINKFMYGNEEHQGLLDILRETKKLPLTEKARDGQSGTIQMEYSGYDIAEYVEGYTFDKIPGRDKVGIDSVITRQDLQGNGGYLIMRLDTDGDGESDRTWSFKVDNDKDFYKFHELLSFYSGNQ